MATEIHRDSGVRYLGHNLTLDDDPLKRNVDVYGREEDRAEIERFTGSITETDDTDDYVSAWYPSKPLVYSGYYYHPACPDEHEPAFFVRTSWYATPDDLKKCDMGDFSTDYLCEVLAEVDDQWGNNDYVILDEDEWASRLTAGLDTEGPKDGYTWAVYFACREGHVAVLDRLLAAAGLGVEDLRDKNNLAVRFACASGHVEVLDRLLTAGLGVEDLRDRNNEAVRTACEMGHVEMLDRLLAAGLGVEDLRARNNEAVRMACEMGHVEILDRLLAAGLDVGDLRAAENFAIGMACENGHAAVLDRLLAAGLGIDDLGDDGNYAISMACENGHTQVLGRLVVYYGSSFRKDWVQEILAQQDPAKWRSVMVAMRTHSVLPAAGRRAAVVIQRRVREFLLAPVRIFDPDSGARRRAALRLDDSYRAMAKKRGRE